MTARACWSLVLSLSAAGTLAAHDVAYRLAGAAPDDLHGYLAHAPQILLALVLPAALVAVSATRGSPRPWLFGLLGASGFTLLEYAERLAHGETPWLLFTTPLYLLGLALQLPFALAAWWLARALVGLERPVARRPVALARVPHESSEPARRLRAHGRLARVRMRGPPRLLPI
jgi:hypothetical protein